MNPGQVVDVRVTLAPDILAGSTQAADVPSPAADRARTPSAPSTPRGLLRLQRGLAGVGAGISAGGLAIWAVARHRFGRVVDGCEMSRCSEQEVRERWDRQGIDPLRRAAIALAAVGGAALASGSGLYLWRRSGERGREHRTEAIVAVHGMGLRVTVRR